MYGNTIGIVVSMKEEAAPIIKHFGLDQAENNSTFIGKNLCGEPIILMISGIGMQNAQNTVWSLATLGCDKIISFGSSGFMGDVLEEVFYPNIFFNADFDMTAFGTPTKDPCNVNARYVLSNSVPENPVELYTCSTCYTGGRSIGHLIDMETYSEVSAAMLIGIPFISVRVVSSTEDDNIDNGVSSLIERNKLDIAAVINNFDAKYQEIYKSKSVEE